MSQNTQEKSKTVGRRAVLGRSALAALVVAGVFTVVWYVLDSQVRTMIADSTEATARGVEVLISKDIETRVGSLSALAQQLGEPTATARKDWESMAKIVYGAQAGYRSIGWIDPSFHVRWIFPIAGNEAAQGFDLRLQPAALAAAKLARERNTVALSTPLESIHGGKGIGIFVPVNVSTDDGEKSDGLVGSMLLIDPLLYAILPLDVMTDHIVNISINGKNLFSTAQDQDVVDRNWFRKRQFELYDVSWQLDVAPTADYLSGTYFKFLSAMLVLFILLSSLVPLTTYYLLRSRGRAKMASQDAQRLKRLLTNIPGMSYRSQACYPWSMDFVSEGCRALCGYERDALETDQVLWGEFIHPDDLDRVKRSVAEAVERKTRFDIEYRIRTRAGEERWVWDRGGAIYSDEDNDLSLDGFLTDITDRKRIERSLTEEKGYSESIVAAAIDAVITVGADGKVEAFNPAAQMSFGYTLEEMEGKDFSLLMSTPYSKEYEELFSNYQKTGEMSAEFERREVIGKRRDGSEFPVQVSISKMQHQTELKLVCFLRDVSLLISAEREKRELTEKLAHVDRLNMLGEMATGIAHEINQPLTAISLFSQAGKRLLISGKEDRLPEIFDKLSQHALRAGEIVERMQKMTEQHEITLGTVECNSLIEEVTSLAVADARIRDIIIDLELADGLPPVSVDRVQIQQVMLNLLRNGMRAMQSVHCERGDVIKLQTRLCQNNDIEISVIDSGGGVSDEMAEQIFKPFSTTRESGMGLGLSISRAIVLSHGGHIDFFNNDCGGATFYFTLPAADPGELDG